MIGDIIAKVRKDKQISKTDLSKETNINVGHLTHIEKGERNPSHKALRTLCLAMDIPFQPLMYTFDKELTQEQKDYNAFNHIKYDSIPIISNIVGFTKCTKEMAEATFALKINDEDMSPKIKMGSMVYVEMNTPLNNKDIGVFEYNGKLLIRKFIIRRKDIVLRAEKDDIEDIILTKDDEFYIIGKILGNVVNK